MATKTKAKKRSRAKQKNKKIRRRSGSVGVAIVSSISLTQTLQTAIMNGVKTYYPNVAPLTAADFVDQLGYDPGVLKTAISGYDKASGIGVIITVGGGVTYEAAEAAGLTTPFVSIVGQQPTKPGKACKGGVSLHCSESDIDRVEHLVIKKHKKNNILLYYNSKSAMQAVEVASWGGPMFPTTVDPDNYVPGSGTFGNDFNNIVTGFPNVTAVVMSADPFFQEEMPDLTSAAYNSGLAICYPLQDYQKSKTIKKGSTTLHGPTLTDAYNDVGQAAGMVLAKMVKGKIWFGEDDTTNDI